MPRKLIEVRFKNHATALKQHGRMWPGEDGTDNLCERRHREFYGPCSIYIDERVQKKYYPGDNSGTYTVTNNVLLR